MPKETKEQEVLKKLKNNEKVTSSSKIKKTNKPTTKKSNSLNKKDTDKALKTSTKKSNKTNKKSTTSTKKNTFNTVEYYDLPFRYNQTVVKVLAQTPSTLFIYWDISDEDKENYKKLYGDNFFETTKPVLIVHNNTLNYSFEVEINDFANSWYLHVNDSKSDYKVEIGRRPIVYNSNFNNDYVHITTSNGIQSPNDHILFDSSKNMVFYKNVKNNKETSKSISNLSFIRNMGKIYNIYDLYKKIYKNEHVEDIYDYNNPSSNV